ncbi:M15 family metallopeptidase [Enemella sp. A6]|uniref:M15 family metallopeptidase n=1 Tax=Enemella sp. A6 TaxID=3440152 RepID=UPI003EBEB889
MSRVGKSLSLAAALLLLASGPAFAESPTPDPSEEPSPTVPADPSTSPSPTGDPTTDESESPAPSPAPTEPEPTEPDPTEPESGEDAGETPPDGERDDQTQPPPSSEDESGSDQGEEPEQSEMEKYALEVGLGKPNQQPVSVAGGQVQYFERGVVTNHPEHGMHYLRSPILTKVHSSGGVATVGYPTTNPYSYHGHQAQRFSTGIEIWTSSRGTYRIRGSILARYKAMSDATRKQIGQLTCDEKDAHAGGRMSCFVSGDIYWSPRTKASEVVGALRTAYAPVRTQLGLPTGPPRAAHGGQVQNFLKGQVVSYRGTTRASYGMIYRAWQQVGGFGGSLGAPTTYEYAVPGGYLQKFTRGMVFYKPGVRTRVHYYAHPNVGVYRTLAAHVKSTYRAGCPVGAASLRTIHVDYWDYNGVPDRGEIIVRTDRSADVQQMFAAMWRAGSPVARMLNPNYFNGSDPAMMRNNNTSGFNCRQVVGNPYARSPHAYGVAVDVNPVQNPYHDARGTWWPENGRSYIRGGGVNRTPMSKGMFNSNSVTVRALESRGWTWGGRWVDRDYHHFQRK